jgi:hypothetical protein
MCRSPTRDCNPDISMADDDPRRPSSNKDGFQYLCLPAELRLLVLASMAGGASVTDWVSLLNSGKIMRSVVKKAFGDWLERQSLGTTFGAFGVFAAETRFVMDQVPGK